MVNLTVNGTARMFDGDEDMPLLWYLRDDLRLTGTRFGCGAGLCGACTVHLDGTAVRACQTPLKSLNNKKVVTIEGLSPNGTHPVQAAWEKTQRRTVRLLSDRSDHAGGLAPDAHAEPERCRYRPRDAGQHLPLRHLSAHSRRDQDRGREARMSVINVSRRQFLGGVFSTGALVLASRVLPESAWAQTPSPLFKTKADLASLNPSVYLGIEPDGTVFIVTHRSEMGTGIRTSLPMVAATSSMPIGVDAASSRASAIHATAIRTLTAHARCATSTTRSAAPVRPRAPCW
jgi:hypothetical protein